MGSRTLTAACLCLLLGVLLVDTPSASAQQDVVLLRLLRDSQSFRVRARAAIALANLGGDANIAALEGALLDSHEAVRSTAATALGQIGTRRSVRALRMAAGDSSPDVAERAKLALNQIAAREMPRPAVVSPIEPVVASGLAALSRARYAVVLGDMNQREGISQENLSASLGALIAGELRKLDYVAVFSLDEMTEDVTQTLTRRKIPAFRLEGTLTQYHRVLLATEYRTRCEVSVLLFDEPQRTLRSLMRGAASGSEQPRGPKQTQQLALTDKTLKSAVQSAMRNAAQAIEAAAIRRDLGMQEGQAEASLDKRGSPRRARFARR